ncbi:MAG: hypothetical protein H6581_09855 [Bacteroidia bacterium]|nr:hypothetical protein [Bacteroidia bacterium]
MEWSRILPECYADTCLVRVLIRENVTNHNCSKGQVANLMRDNKRLQSKALGIVDHDPTRKNVPNYFKTFQLVEESHDLRKLKHPEKNQYLIEICPAFETWILNCAELVNYTKGMDLNQLKKLTKTMKSTDDPVLKQYLQVLLDKKSPPVLTLQEWIIDLME